MKTKKLQTRHKRIIASVFILGFLFALLHIVSGSANCSSSSNLHQVSQGKLRSYISEDGSLQEERVAKDLLNIPELTMQSQIPFVLNKELIDLSNKLDLRINSDIDVLSYIENSSVADVFQQLKTELESKEWNYIESNSQIMGTFIKDTGKYRWCCISVIEEQSQSIVVIQLLKS